VAHFVKPDSSASRSKKQLTQYQPISEGDMFMASTSKRGFASMDPAKQREIASKGGRAAHAKGTAHEFTSDEARVAGRKGGEAVSRDRTHMATIGREGGHSRGARARAAAQGGTTRSDLNRSDLNRPTDVERSGEQVFERQINTERSGFEPAGRVSDRVSEREGSDSSRRDAGPFSGRDRI
jgi:general stress protein YciG